MTENLMFCGEDAFKLENEFLSCICLPRRGGKLVSIVHRKTSFELLFRNPKGFFLGANTQSRFEDFEACGFDDAFPSIDAEIISFNGKDLSYPDHGEIWSSSFDITTQENTLYLSYNSALFNYCFSKSYTLENNRLKCSYSIKNTGKEDFPCFYAMHLLVNIEEGMRLIFPEGTKEILNVMDSPQLNKARTVYSFPKDFVNKIEYDFTSVPSYTYPTMDKYYVNGAVNEGKCGYEYFHSGMRVLIEYDHQKLPYLGFWVTQGAFRGDYNCALEPTNGFYDSISCAQQNGKCPILRQNETLEFEISITLEKI